MSRALLLGTAAGTMLASPLLLALLAVAGTPDQPDLCQPTETTAVAGLDDEQSRNATVITAVGQQAGVPPYGLEIALATAMQESGLRNLPHGDRDSLGLFQQRPSAGWGTAEQLLDPVYAARSFFGGPDGPNTGEPPGLLDIDGWGQMPLTVAAQTVQRSAFSDAYARWEADAAGWLADWVDHRANVRDRLAATTDLTAHVQAPASDLVRTAREHDRMTGHT